MFSVSSTNLVLLSVMTLLCPGHQTKTIYVPGIKIKTHLCPEGIKPKLLYAPWASNQVLYFPRASKSKSKLLYVSRASNQNFLCPEGFKAKHFMSLDLRIKTTLCPVVFKSNLILFPFFDDSIQYTISSCEGLLLVYIRR